MDELISRQTAIEAACEGADDWDGGPNLYRNQYIECYINRVPAEKPRTKCVAEIRLDTDELLDRIEEKHGLVRRDPGKWEDEGISSALIEEWQSARCSNCGKYHTTPYLYYFTKYDYCPNCGAYMGGETDG